MNKEIPTALIEDHFKLLDSVNKAKTEEERYSALCWLLGFELAAEHFDALAPFRWRLEAEKHYRALGIERPLDSGFFSDWKPTR